MKKAADVKNCIAELLAALIDGAFEVPLWDGFLQGLIAATQADYAILIVHPPGRPMDDGLRLAVGRPDASIVAAALRPFLHAPLRTRVPEGKVVDLDDLRPTGQCPADGAYLELIDRHRISASLQVRVVEPNGVEAWLSVLWCESGDYSKHARLLTELAGPLRGVLRAHVLSEKGRLATMMGAEAGRRLQCGWFLLDQHGHILTSDQNSDAMLVDSESIARSASGRLVVRPAKLEREVLAAVEQMAVSPTARPRAISLRSDPWLDMLLVPARKQMISETAVPAVIAYLHGDNWLSADRCAQLCDLFDLSPSEGRLTLALCRGRTIAEAAVDLGLRLETARSYSKSIYAKTGTRGMADLVRVVMGSVLTLAPDS